MSIPSLGVILATVVFFVSTLDIISDTAKSVNDYLNNKTRNNLSNVSKRLFKLISTYTIGALAARWVLIILNGKI